jgi:hypothetical protein
MILFHQAQRGTTRTVAWAALVLISYAGFGCASPEVVQSKGPHAPTSPEYIALYQKEPRKYERLGTITQVVTPEMKFDERGDSTPGFEKLKAQAAEKGANGLLLQLPDGTYDFLVLAGYRGSYYQVPAKRGDPKTVLAEAIYVLEP